MNRPLHFLRLQSTPDVTNHEVVRIVPRADVQWGGPIFRAPALPTVHQLGREVPFFVNFPSKFKRAS